MWFAVIPLLPSLPSLLFPVFLHSSPLLLSPSLFLLPSSLISCLLPTQTTRCTTIVGHWKMQYNMENASTPSQETTHIQCMTSTGTYQLYCNVNVVLAVCTQSLSQCHIDGFHSAFSLWQLEGITSPCCLLIASHDHFALQVL